MQSIHVERHFAAPVEEVWRAYTDHGRWSEWAGVVRSRLARRGSPDPNGSGAVRVLGPLGLAAHEEVVDFEPPRRMSYRVVKGGIPMKNHFGEVVFEPEAGGTRVRWSCRFESRVPGLGPLMGAYVRRFFRTALDGLARRSFPDERG